MADASNVSVSLNPHARIELRHTGRERNPLLIIDDALADPDTLIAAAVAAPWSKPHHTQYPGVNAPLPAAYSQAIIRALRPMLQRGFGLPAHLPLNFFGFFALATQSPDQLQPIQKIPHHDSPDPFRIAMVHYLCRDQAGGTGFFPPSCNRFRVGRFPPQRGLSNPGRGRTGGDGATA
ncbi:MAG: DUF6445 family protein [Asticcacaulis sp.]